MLLQSWSAFVITHKNELLQESAPGTEFSENYISKKYSWFMKDAQGPIYEGKKNSFKSAPNCYLILWGKDRLSQVSMCKCQVLWINQESVPDQRPRDGKLGLC